MFMFGFVPNIFFPPSDRLMVQGEIKLPVGTPIEQTERVAIEVEHFIQDSLIATEDRPGGVTNWATFVGEGAPRYMLPYNRELASPEYAFMMINVNGLSAIPTTISRLEQFTQRTLPDAITKFAAPPLGPPVNSPIEVRISGRDTDVLFGLVDQVKAQLASVGGTRNITDDWGQRTKKLLVNVNEPRARRAGVSSRDVAVSLQTAFSGFPTTQYREEDKIIPVTLRSVEADRNDLGKIESLNVYAQATGQTVPLKQVADVEVVWQPSKIRRRDRFRTVAVLADVERGVTAAEVNAQLVPWLEEESAEWALGYRYEIGGEAEEARTSQASINVKMPIMMLIIVLLLVAQFNSFRRPLIILLTIPLGLIGVVFGLLVTGSYFGFMTLLGVFALDRSRATPAATDSVDDGDHCSGVASALVWRRTHVEAHGNRDHLRALVRHRADVGLCAAALFALLPRELQGLRVRCGGSYIFTGDRPWLTCKPLSIATSSSPGASTRGT